MFASIQRGFGFLGQAIDLARKDSDLLKPSFYSLLVSAVVALIGAAPLVVVALLAGDTQPGKISLYVLGALLIFVQYTIAYVFSGMTAFLVYEYLTEGDGRMDQAWAIVTTAYHTCLFLWAREAEKAISQGQSAQAARVPAPLAAVLAH